jgi:hypothetical protein
VQDVLISWIGSLDKLSLIHSRTVTDFIKTLNVQNLLILANNKEFSAVQNGILKIKVLNYVTKCLCKDESYTGDFLIHALSTLKFNHTSEICDLFVKFLNFTIFP